MEKGPTVDRVRQNRRGEDRQNYKNQKTHKINRKEQYREILKQIQEKPSKTKYKGKS
jgi:triacylglycerol esterase/lipase EstA (alpha/beta hydrolase family)